MARIKYYDNIAQEWAYADMAVAMPSSRLPSAYQEVEYIESTGTQRIETGLTNTEDCWRFVASLCYSDVTTRQLNGAQGGCYFGVVNGKIQFIVGGTNSSSIPVYANKWFDIDATLTAVASGTSSNAIYASTKYETATFTATDASYDYKICLFSLNEQVLPSSCKISKFKIYKNSKLLRDFVPCYRIADDEIGMYDIVNDVFYTNAGTGTFIKGADV